MIAQHRPFLVGALIGAVTFVLLVRLAYAGTGDPGPDAVSLLSSAGVAILGGIACLIAARLLATARARWGWLRRGWAGNLAATAYGALTAFGAVVAIGAGVDAGLAAIGGALGAGMGLAADRDSARFERAARDPEAP